MEFARGVELYRLELRLAARDAVGVQREGNDHENFRH